MFLDALVRKLWEPNKRIDSLVDLTQEDVNHLYDDEIRLLVLDVDGSITDYHGKAMGEGINEVIQYARSIGIEVWLYSNCSKDREKELKEYFGEYVDLVVGRALKPLPFKFWYTWYMQNRECQKKGKDKISLRNMAWVDDQYSTGITLGNLLHGFTIKIDGEELIENEPPGKQKQRRWEERIYRMAFAKYIKNGIIKNK